MASDPRKLKPSELCRLLNSTPLGEVISERQLYRHRQRAGARIGDNKTVDLLRYCAGGCMSYGIHLDQQLKVIRMKR